MKDKHHRLFTSLLVFVALVAKGQAQIPKDLTRVSPGERPGPQLKIKKLSGVPAYDFAKNPGATLPRLNVGREPELQFNPIELKLPEVLSLDVLKVKRPQGILHAIQSEYLSPVTLNKKDLSAKPVQLVKPSNLESVPGVPQLKEIPEPKLEEPKPQQVTVLDWTPQDFKILEGLIFFEYKKSTDIALAYFSELLSDKTYRDEALYHYARTCIDRGLHSEARASWLKISSESKSREWRVQAAQALADHIEKFDVSDMETIDPVVVAQEIDISKNEAYNFYRAKYYLEKGQLGQVEDALGLISEKSPHYNDSLLISALYSYRLAKLDAAQGFLQDLLKRTTKQDPLHSAGAITLARIQFQKGDYPRSFQSYLEVDRSHALWLSAMVEQAWTQILKKDYEGAAGNMFSLHTDFFKNAYNPESYVVRTVGYLNLCQFGDAIQVLNNLGKRYAPIQGRLTEFAKSKKDADLYDVIRQLLKNPNLREIETLPRSFILELARHPSFINLQKHLNNYEDEMGNFNKVTLNIIQREKDLLSKQGEVNKDLSELRMKFSSKKLKPEDLKSLKEQEKNLERELFAAKFEYQSVNRARNQVKEIREKAFGRIEEEKKRVRVVIKHNLEKRFETLSEQLKGILDQLEVLQYEIYSGAGEQLRYQAAGGDVSTEKREVSAKDKSTTWKFKGEIWEDEIGHFRSSLKNVCPTEN